MEIKKVEDLSGELNSRNFDDRIYPLARLDPSLARETLGIFLAMEGNQRSQTEQLKNKSRIYARITKKWSDSQESCMVLIHSSIFENIRIPNGSNYYFI